ncbi:hypothetical protein [Cohnella sp. JJ-181]|uniref:hypothetical protein n=1 Tax=Cohnella rhizoplanae TaxID=2974897 RepID=UPI0022FF90EA|nr:hypothetical protein [Cohnella sp. JJ-181]CAI6087155.1 hypothetical protein COHCIP112018_05357 [Cohnella sp. JJ-181]
MDVTLDRIKLAIQKNGQVSEVLSNKNYKYQIRKKDAIYILKNEANEFTVVYLKKGCFGWGVRMKFDLNGINFDIVPSEKITNLLLSFDTNTLVISRCDMDDFDKLHVNGQETMRFEIAECNKAFNFFIEDKKKDKVVEGFNTFGQKTYINKLEIQSIELG